MTTPDAPAATHAPEETFLPAELPPPEVHPRPSWFVALLVGVGAALFAGFCLFAVGRGFYLFVLLGGAAGAMVGWPFAWGLKHVHAVDRGAAAIAVTLLLGLVYLAYSFGYYLWWTNENFGGLHGQLSFRGYWQMLEIKAENFTMFRTEAGWPGAIVAWTLDYLVGWYVAWGAVDLVLMWETARLAPHATARMVFHLKREGYKDDHIRQRLAERGWSRPEDQAAAFRAAAAAERLHRLGVRIFAPATRSASA